MKHFKEFIRETSGKVTITFDHFNPPSIETEKLIQKVHEAAQGGPYRIYTSQECNENSPLDYSTKIKFMRKMFPRHARSIISDSTIEDLYDVLHSLYEQGYTKVNLVMPNIPAQLKECVDRDNGNTKADKLYNFAEINYISVDVVDVHQKIVEAVRENNFELFAKNLPSNLKEGQRLFNAIRSSLGLKESFNFRQHIQLPTLSKEREAYVNGELFKIGDVIEVKESKEIGQIKRLGSNYVIIETYEGNKQRKWLRDIVKVEEAVINKMMEKMDNPCWSNYTMVGTKEKSGKTVPNCVPKNNTKSKFKSFKEDLSTFNGK
jgi:hypothetical protein